MAYADAVPAHWLLGLTAAARGLPLIIVGLGRPFNGVWPRIAREHDAAQIIRELAPDVPLLSVEADTVVVNDVSEQVASTARRVIERPDLVVLHTECARWPQCHAEEFARVQGWTAEFGRCTARPLIRLQPC